MVVFSTGVRRGVALFGLMAALAAPITSIATPAKADPARTAQTLLSLETRALSRVGTNHLKGLVTPVPANAKAVAKAPGKMTYDKAWLNAQPRATGGKEWRCLAEALYFEARGETLDGLFAVGEVIMNRVASKRFPNSICGVVNQGTGRKFACQFTYTCDGRPEHINEPASWERVGKVARAVIDGAPRALTKGATHYHATWVNPSWARKYTKTYAHGVHIFYKHTWRGE